MDWLAPLAGFALGISLAAPPGPMNALIAKEASGRGAWSGIRVGLGAPVADVLWLLILLLGVGRLLEGDTTLRVAALLGAGIMAWFAYGTWLERDPEAARRPASFWAGLSAALTNPYQAAWWLSGGFVLIQSQGLAVVPGFLLGIFGWVATFSWLVAHGARRWRWFGPAIRFMSAALLAGFAVLLACVAWGIVEL